MFQIIPTDVFQSRTGIVDLSDKKAKYIVSLRDLDPQKITKVEVMPFSYLEKLIRSVPLEGDKNIKPYAKSKIVRMRIDPSNMRIGQTFVERKKYQTIVEDFGNLLDGKFCVSRGFAKCNPLIVVGKNKGDNNVVIAHYLPPIVEARKGYHFLLDGIHRDYLIMKTGTTIEGIVIENVEIPLPCLPQSWDTIQIVSEKPPREERFRKLKKNLFRDLKFVGIDG